MNLFIPEIIYDRIKTDLKFQEKHKKLDDEINQNMNCIVTYSEFTEQNLIYEDLLNYLNLILTEKEKKIWDCFILNVNYDENDSLIYWKKTDDVIQQCKNDSDIDVKMYAYYMELANTTNHESQRWIKNIEESIELWKKYEDRKFDVRLYTKYYWDHHEKLIFYNKLKTKKNIVKCYEDYEELDLNLKKFLETKYDSRYFWDIINHKTTYTALMFWGSINNDSQNDIKESLYVLNKIHQKIINLDHKYSNFNMHFLEWHWSMFKFFIDVRDREKIIFVWNEILNIIENALQDRKKLIKSLTHHNFSYASNIMVFVSNLLEIEKQVIKKFYPNYEKNILDFGWTKNEKRIMLENNQDEMNKYYLNTGQRQLTISNYKTNMLNSVVSQFN